jgi:hypothetical protein
MTEKQEASRDNARLQKNSGRGKHDKGDAVLDDAFLIDYKEYSKSFSLTEQVWAKVCTDAFRAGGYEPLLKIVLGQGQNKIRLFVMSETLFHDMKDRYLDQSVVQ